MLSGPHRTKPDHAGPKVNNPSGFPNPDGLSGFNPDGCEIETRISPSGLTFPTDG